MEYDIYDLAENPFVVGSPFYDRDQEVCLIWGGHFFNEECWVDVVNKVQKTIHQEKIEYISPIPINELHKVVKCKIYESEQDNPKRFFENDDNWRVLEFAPDNFVFISHQINSMIPIKWVHELYIKCKALLLPFELRDYGPSMNEIMINEALKKLEDENALYLRPGEDPFENL